MSNVDLIISRLEKVKRTGASQWMGCCPAHEDRSPSLSVKDAGDGRILLKCFAGCETENVLGALGLTFEDVMPEKITDYAKPEKLKVYASDMLKILRVEFQIVMLAAMELNTGKKLSEKDYARLLVAAERINTGLDAV